MDPAERATEGSEERRKAEEALWREQKLFLEGPVTVFRWVAAAGWPVEYVSPNVIQFGYQADDFMSGRVPYANVVHKDDLARVTQEVDRLAASGATSFEQDYRIVRPDGQVRCVYDRTVVVRDAAGRITHYDGYILDVTDRKQAEAERKRLEAEIQHAQKLESLGLLAGGIAHDFNNLLMGILGHASLARLDLTADSQAHENLQQIELAARRASELTNQMLAYSGRGRFVVELVDLSTLVAEMARLLETVLSKKATLELKLAPRLPPIEADATQLRQVVMNLITNASDALDGKPGRIRVATRVERSAKIGTDALPHGAIADGDCVMLDVSDDGRGMSEATRRRIFDPFFTTKERGRGLGLAAVLGIVRGHRGAIRVDSGSGRGTTFQVFFPAARAVEPAPVERPTSTLATPRDDGTVLVIDDEFTVRDVARRMFERLGFRVLLAENGRIGVEVMRAHAADLTVVLLDLTMPEKNGDEVLAEIRRQRADLPVILSSGWHEQDSAARLAADPRCRFLQKPYTTMDLERTLLDLLAGVPRSRTRGA